MMTTEGKYLVRLVHRRQLVVGPLSFPSGMNTPELKDQVADATCEAHKETREETDY